MESGQKALTIFSDSNGMFLVSRPGSDPFRDAWLIRTTDDGRTVSEGPRAFAQFLKFVPSDWGPEFQPLPTPVQAAIDAI